MYGNCKRCGRPTYGETTLIGGYIAALCISCRNDWHSEMMVNDDYIKINKLEITLKIAMDSKEDVLSLDYIDRMIISKDHLFEFAKEWVNKKIDRGDERDESEPEPPPPPAFPPN